MHKEDDCKVDNGKRCDCQEETLAELTGWSLRHFNEQVLWLLRVLLCHDSWYYRFLRKDRGGEGKASLISRQIYLQRSKYYVYNSGCILSMSR
jgi:hypothetical protein